MAAALPNPPPDRFRVQRGTLWFDSFMTHFIKVGGFAVIAAVFGILLYILLQVIPLFQAAEVKPVAVVPLQGGASSPALAMVADESAQAVGVLRADGTMVWPAAQPGGEERREALAPLLGLPESTTIAAAAYRQQAQQLLVAANNEVFLLQVSYTVNEAQHTVAGQLKRAPLPPVMLPEGRIAAVDFDGETNTVAYGVLLQPAQGLTRALVVRARVVQGQPELDLRDFAPDAGPVAPATLHPLPLPVSATHVRVGELGDAVLVARQDGRIAQFGWDGRQYALVGEFRPFPEEPARPLAAIDFLLGKVSLVVTSQSGAREVWANNFDPAAGRRAFLRTKTYAALGADPTPLLAPSMRNRLFLAVASVGEQSEAALYLNTTAEIRWRAQLPFVAERVLVGEKYQALFFLDRDHQLHRYAVRDPHPEASLQAYFGLNWYEGQPAPSHTWQSTGGSTDFEPKLSLIPLAFGSLKGTFYALLFAVPVALLAAIYTSQFLRPSWRNVVKPTMEVMASLPSVVLGFFGALFLAPLVERQMPSVLLALTLVPMVACLFGWAWNQLSYPVRRRIPNGLEFVIFFPLMLVLLAVAWSLGPLVEQWLFVVEFRSTDPATGQPLVERVADFRLWWPEVTGTPFNQRNSLLVGFMMGFAVIPIIFTIAEDAISNVPRSLISGSLALGASRWQTTARVVLPMATAGIFSALMIGLGRAVGETMIVVMATGNTPIMEWNPFSGMRTLSANIAVELPEAPFESTLYRTLFFGALCLFVLTFVINTVAEVLRQRLRAQYKNV